MHESTVNLSGKVALITGASRGIGEAIAYRFAQAGASVVVTARTLDDGDHKLAGGINNVVETIRSLGGTAIAIRADLGLEDHRCELIKAIERRVGPVDILINNAAVTYFTQVVDFSKKHFDLMFRVQVEAPFHLSQLVLPSMLERGHGSILNISSHAAIHPAKDVGGRGGTVYGMCKASLERLTTGLASEMFGRGINVNVISPGLVATPGTLHHHLITDETPEERVTPVAHMAEACLYLVSADPSEATGWVAYADDLMERFSLIPAVLPPLQGL